MPTINLHQLPNCQRAKIWMQGKDIEYLPFTDFILTDVQENISEAVVMHTTRQQTWVKSLGYDPVYKVYMGIVPLHKEWDLQYQYLKNWRATKCVGRNAKCVVEYSNSLNIGYMDMLNISIDNNRRYATFNMRQLVIHPPRHTNISVDPVREAEIEDINKPLKMHSKAGFTRGIGNDFNMFVFSNISKQFTEKTQFDDKGSDIAVSTFGSHPVNYTIVMHVSREVFKQDDAHITGETEFYRKYLEQYNIASGATDVNFYYMDRSIPQGMILNPSISSTGQDLVTVQVSYLANKEEICISHPVYTLTDLDTVG